MLSKRPHWQQSHTSSTELQDSTLIQSLPRKRNWKLGQPVPGIELLKKPDDQVAELLLHYKKKNITLGLRQVQKDGNNTAFLLAMADKLSRCFALRLHPLVHLASDHLWCNGPLNLDPDSSLLQFASNVHNICICNTSLCYFWLSMETVVAIFHVFIVLPKKNVSSPQSVCIPVTNWVEVVIPACPRSFLKAYKLFVCVFLIWFWQVTSFQFHLLTIVPRGLSHGDQSVSVAHGMKKTSNCCSWLQFRLLESWFQSSHTNVFIVTKSSSLYCVFNCPSDSESGRDI